MSQLRIKVKHGFVFHQKIWIWNGFHLRLKLPQGAAVRYVVSVLLTNVWTYLPGNQTSIRFLCMPPAVEKYLALPKEEINSDRFAEEKLMDDRK